MGMSILHHMVPEDCERYNNGLHCNFRKCPFIHNTAQREEALHRRQQQEKTRTKIISDADTWAIRMQNRWSQPYGKDNYEGNCYSSDVVRRQNSGTKKGFFNTKVSASALLQSNCKSTCSSYSVLEYKHPVKTKSNNKAPISVKGQQNHSENHVNKPNVYVCPKNKRTPEARILSSGKNSGSEISDSKKDPKISPTHSRTECESTTEEQPDEIYLRQIREELSNWAPERLKMIDSLSEKRRQAYYQDMLKKKNQDSSISTEYETKEQLTSEPKPSEKQQTFHPFPRLPAEIRNQIWECARQDCVSTCHVLLDLKQEPGESIVVMKGKYQIVPNPIVDARFRYLYHVPGLFGACRESRSFVETLYGKPKMIAFDRATQQPYPSGKGSCILNFEQDRLFFISCGSFSQIPDLVKFMKPEERNQIKHLAIPFRDYFHENITVTRSLVHFPNLQTLDLILGDDKEDLRRIGHNLDYSDFIQKALREQHLLEDSDSLAGDENDNANGGENHKWTIPTVRTEMVDKSKARAWKIDGFRWETTTKSVPPRLVEA